MIICALLSSRYFPIVFPEFVYPPKESSAKVPDAGASINVDRATTTNSDTRPVLLCSWKDEGKQAPFVSEDIDAPARWQPVNRRRFRGKGWHVDIGPGIFSPPPKLF